MMISVPAEKGKTKVKTKVKISLQFYLLTFMAALGFSDVYAVIWRLVGLPLAWWAAVVCALLGLLSEWGLLAWVEKTGKERAKLAAEHVNEVEAGYWGVCEDACKTEIYSEGNETE